MLFRAYGHPNVRSLHRLTFEFTKDKDLTPRGDCIIGVNADFSLDEITKLLHYPSLEITVTAGPNRKVITAKTNPAFCSAHEIVVRRGIFLSDRTLGTESDTVARDFLPWVPLLRNPGQEIIVEIKGK